MKKVIFTVDVEGHVGSDPVEYLIYGNVGGEKCGIDLIMDLCDQYSVKGIFFVDIAEAFHYGKEKIAGVLRHIHERGHEVGVHIHPDHMGDRKRLFLYEYTDEEQYEMLRECTQFYHDVLGEAPRFFRAGKYSANRKTLDLLKDLGYVADFSEFYGQKWCGITPPVCGTESVKLENGLVEIPTMSYHNSFPGLFSRYDKIDAAMWLQEYRHVMRKLAHDGYTDPIVLFAHSFSLIDWRSRPDAPKKDSRAVVRLDRMFAYVRNSDLLTFCTMDDVLGNEFSPEEKPKILHIGGLAALLYMIPRGLKVLKMRYDKRKLRQQLSCKKISE